MRYLRHGRIWGAAPPFAAAFAPALAVLAVAALAALLLPDSCGAIPAFARKYRFSCSTCHAPAPRLKAYGQEFAGNAFRLEENEEPKHYFYDTGDELLLLQRELPVAIRFDAFVQYRYRDEKDVTDLKTPYGLKLMSGGNIAKHIGYYLYFYMSEAGEVAGIEDAYIHFNNLFDVDLDVMVGQFQVSDPLFKRELRLTFEDYEIYATRVGLTPTDLTYDRGLMITYGSPVGLDAVFELVNGNGKGAELESGNFDDDDWKNVMLRLSQQIGPVRIGGFGYLGNSHLWSSGGVIENEHYYAGGDATIDVGDRLQINGQYLLRNDENPFLSRTDPREVDTKGGFVEIVWAMDGEMGRPWLTVLYNRIDSDLDDLDYNSVTVSFGWLLKRNLRLLAETTYEDVEERYRFVTGIVSAF